MISQSLLCLALFFCLIQSIVFAQISVFPYNEKFDTVVAPNLPAGWSTSTSKSPSGDFLTSTSTPLSVPNAVVSTDAKVAQGLTSPEINFSGKIPGTLEFYERRTSSHTSGLCVEAIINDDTATAILIGDTLKNPGTTNYVLRSLPLPPLINGQRDVRFRWRVVGNGTGATGTLRIDNVKISVQKMLDLAVTHLTVDPENPRTGERAVHPCRCCQSCASAATLHSLCNCSTMKTPTRREQKKNK